MYAHSACIQRPLRPGQVPSQSSMALPERYKWSDEEMAALNDLSLTRVRPMVCPLYLR